VPTTAGSSRQAPGRGLGAVAAGLDAATSLDGQKSSLLHFKRIVVQAMHCTSIVDQLEQRTIVDGSDLLLAGRFTAALSNFIRPLQAPGAQYSHKLQDASTQTLRRR
jgi:hypothetical protein